MEQVSSGAVVQHEDGSILLLHYIGGHWDFIKGKIDPGEDELQTLHREAEEETGIKDLKLIDGFRKEIDYWFHMKGQNIHKVVIFRAAKTKTKQIVLSDEHQGYEWVSFDEAMKRLTFENARNILAASKEFLDL